MTASSPAAPLSVRHGSTLLWSLRQLCLVIPLRQAVSHHYRVLIKSGMSQWQCPSVGAKRRQPANSVWERGSRDEWSTAPHLRDGKWQCCKCVCVSERECLHECPLVHKRCVIFSAVWVSVCVSECAAVRAHACIKRMWRRTLGALLISQFTIQSPAQTPGNSLPPTRKQKQTLQTYGLNPRHTNYTN